ncbi:hypothetical protein BC834DRAFT_858759 [Gloeopeniophorella convolvens]|nr:hypothetical protein BC834DRAFT_858759 [Gloeopeniophorella convolvens]
MTLSPLFNLSNELLLEILSSVCAKDICACRRTCRKLNALIDNSLYIQYILRTAQSGVSDPFEPGFSIPERMDSLCQWENAWAVMDLRMPTAHIDAPVSPKHERPVEFSFGRYFVVIREGYGWPAGYSFLDMRDGASLHADTAQWTTIDIDLPNVLVFAFASELDLVVAISAPSPIDPHLTNLKICPMSFSTGKIHPQAAKESLEVSVSGASAYNLSDTEVIGDYILFWVGSPDFSPTNEGTLCSIYLIAWKEGWISELRHSSPGVYGSVLSVLSEDIVLLVRLNEPALELCRLSHIVERKPTLETVCTLSLPSLVSTARMQWATCFGEHPGHALFSRQHPPPSNRHTHPRRHLRSVPENGIISVVMHIHNASGGFRTVDLSVHCRTLLAHAPPHRPMHHVRWEDWGPPCTRILEHRSLTWGSLVGERRATVGRRAATGLSNMPVELTLRDYNPYRVGLALERTGALDQLVELESGTVIRVVTEPSVFPKDDFFRSKLETRMPYVETITTYPGCEGIFMDEDNLLAEDDDRRFFLHCM